MIKKVLFAVGVVVLVLAVLAGIKLSQFAKLGANAKHFVMPPETVSSAVAREEKWQDTFSAIGSVVAEQGVNVTTEIPGIVREIAFESGAVVTNGALLLRL